MNLETREGAPWTSRFYGHPKQVQHLQAFAHNSWPQALLLSGPESVGKRFLALLCIQQTLCAIHKGCGHCGPCKRVQQEESEALHLLGGGGERIKIDAIRSVVEMLQLRSIARYQFVVIDGAESMTLQAANALLKTLEEPPPQTTLILVTSNLSKIPPTLQSRCHKVGFAALSTEDLHRAYPESKNFPNWLLSLSLGRLDLLKEYASKEFQSLRQACFEVFRLLFQKEYTKLLSNNFVFLENRESFTLAIRLWQQMVRDILVVTTNPEALYHQDQKETLEHYWNTSRSSDSAVGISWSKLLQELTKMEQGVNSFVDRRLLFDDFLISLKRFP